MSCCQRPSVPVPDRWASADPGQPQTNAVPGRLRFIGARALSLPVGHHRVLVHPGEELRALSEAERNVLWRTGLFEPVL